MNSLFNSGPEPSADEPLRPQGSAAAQEQGEPDDQMLFSSVRRAGGGSSAGSGSGSSGSGDKEITLGTMTVLGIFFALAVLCAGFFAFGYSAGSKHTPKAGPGAALTDAGMPGCKPAPGSLVGVSAPAGNVAPANVPYTPPSGAAVKPVATMAPAPMAETLPVPAVASPPPPAVVEHTAARTPVAAVPVSTAPAATPAGEQTTMVQVAALSHQEDAETVASALKGRGYNVSIHTSANDRLLHVQLGPYPSRKDADAVRQRLLNDGFNAILK